MESLQASSTTLEITVISAENLYVDRSPVTENAYVVVRAESLNCYTTSMAGESSGSPSWNEKFFLDIPSHARSVTFEVLCKLSTGAVRSVGVARIALSNFLAKGAAPENSQFLTYRLRNWDGRRNGVINFSVKVKAPEYPVPAAKGMMLMNPAEFECEFRGIHVSDKNSKGIAIGVPVQWNHHHYHNPSKVLTCN